MVSPYSVTGKAGVSDSPRSHSESKARSGRRHRRCGGFLCEQRPVPPASGIARGVPWRTRPGRAGAIESSGSIPDPAAAWGVDADARGLSGRRGTVSPSRKLWSKPQANAHALFSPNETYCGMLSCGPAPVKGDAPRRPHRRPRRTSGAGSRKAIRPRSRQSVPPPLSIDTRAPALTGRAATC